MTAKRGLIWYVDGELFCFPVSGEEANMVSNNHRRLWETLPHSLTCGMPYNYFPRGRVELRCEKAMVYLHPTLCTPEIFARIRHAFLLPDEMQVSFKADGNRQFRKNRRGEHWTYSGQKPVALRGTALNFSSGAATPVIPPP